MATDASWVSVGTDRETAVFAAARPLTSHEAIVNLIANTRTRTGVTVAAELDDREYPKGIKISDQLMRDIETHHIRRHDWHPEWNYTFNSR